MRKTDLILIKLPGLCPDGFSMGMGWCGASFRDFANIYQDTDGIVYCMNCRILIGPYKPGTVPFKRRDDNVLP